MTIRAKNGKGILVERNGTKFSRKASADQRSPRVKALQGCVKSRTEGKNAGSREEWQEIFKKASKKCKEDLEL